LKLKVPLVFVFLFGSAKIEHSAIVRRWATWWSQIGPEAPDYHSLYWLSGHR